MTAICMVRPLRIDRFDNPREWVSVLEGDPKNGFGGELIQLISVYR